MMDMLTNIEEQLKNVLLLIDSSTTNTNGYQFYNTVTQVNIDDEAVAIDRGYYPTINVYLDSDDTVEYSDQYAYRNKAIYKLVGNVALLDEVEFPRFAIRQKMNELYSDIKAILRQYSTLNCSCDIVTIQRMYRTYNQSSDVFRAGQVNIIIAVEYYQSALNPNNKCTI